MQLTNNEKAFLKMLTVSEGTSTSKYTKNNGYDVIVNGIGGEPKIFTDYSKHPNVLVTVNNKGLKSTAAGAYQILYKYWVAYKKQLGLKGFYPEDQDAIAMQLIKECKARDDINTGRIESAITKCRSRWASLPGAGYGQFEHKMDTLVSAYKKAGGTVA
jgi:muramidase (phage lysozyme)